MYKNNQPVNILHGTVWKTNSAHLTDERFVLDLVFKRNTSVLEFTELTSGKKMKGYHAYHCNELETNNDFDIWWMECSSKI